MRTLLILWGILSAAPVQAQALCPVPTDPPFTFGLTASRGELDRTQYFRLDQGWALYMSYSSRSDIPAAAMPSAYVPLFERDSVEVVVRPLYTLAREVICGVRFPDAEADSITQSFHAPIAEVWIEVGNASLGTRLDASALPPAASALFEELDRLVQSGE